MPVKVTIDKNAVVARIEAASKKAIAVLSQQALSDCNEFCPEDQGLLKDSVDIHSDLKKGLLVWSTPYARYLYYGVLMVDPVTKKACFPIPDGHGGTRLVSRKGIDKIKSSPEISLKYHKKHNSSTPCKLWCEKARETYNDDWRVIYQNALKGGL